MDPVNVSAEFDVRGFTRSGDNRGYPQKLGSLWIRPRSLFSEVFNGPLLGWTLYVYLPILTSVALPVPEIIAIEVWDGGEAQSWGRGGRTGLGMVPFERGLMTSYRHSIVTFPLSLPVSEILPFLCASGPIFSHPPLVTPKFRHVPLELGGWRLGSKEWRSWANCPCNQFPRLPN